MYTPSIHRTYAIMQYATSMHRCNTATMQHGHHATRPPCNTATMCYDHHAIWPPCIMPMCNMATMLDATVALDLPPSAWGMHARTHACAHACVCTQGTTTSCSIRFHHNYFRHLGIADGMSVARVWACWYSK